jgi:ATP adenylyltransferase/5',5'''-P-1,P-4-tetraphosphate phosphorylase II
VWIISQICTILVLNSDTQQIEFHIFSALRKKPAVNTQVPAEETERQVELKRRRQCAPGSDIDIKDFKVHSINGTHDLAVNKFALARPHLLLLTKDGFKRQWEALDKADLMAAWRVLTSLGDNYTITYNCGEAAGCSRIHKHLQVLPSSKTSVLPLDSQDRGASLPFQYFQHLFQTQLLCPDKLSSIYQDLLLSATKTLQVQEADVGHAYPHNMILTNRWIMVIPRKRSGLNGANSNAQGMLGNIAVSSKEEAGKWIKQGPLNVLAQLGVSRIDMTR